MNLVDLQNILSESENHSCIKINKATSVLFVFFPLGLVFLVQWWLGCGVLAFPKSLSAATLPAISRSVVGLACKLCLADDQYVDSRSAYCNIPKRFA